MRDFLTSEIEAHADGCIDERYPSILIRDDTASVPQVELYESSSHSMNDTEVKDLFENLEAARKAVKRTVAQLLVTESGEFANLLVFRGSCFDDFHSFFSKTWNNDKIGKKYIIRFAGEEGIDDGGVSREFYSGEYTYIYIYIFIYKVIL